MTKMPDLRLAVAAFVVVVALAGCGDDDDDEVVAPSDSQVAAELGVVACSEWPDGAEVSFEEFMGGCMTGETLNGSGSTVCTDGSQIAWNDYGWWQDGVVHVHEAGAEKVAPQDVRDACTG